jgi:hypothetical protein
MMMAASGIFQWSGRERGAATASQDEKALVATALMPPQLVAEALFAELGLDRFLSPAATPGERLMGDILLFAAGVIPGDAEPSAGGLLAEEAVADSALLASPAAEEGSGLMNPPQPDERDQGDAGPMADASEGAPADIAGTSVELAAHAKQGWLVVDMSEPREWSADDLAMLIYRDCADVAESLARRADRAMIEDEAEGAAGSGHHAFPDEGLDEFSSEDRFAA